MEVFWSANKWWVYLPCTHDIFAFSEEIVIYFQISTINLTNLKVKVKHPNQQFPWGWDTDVISGKNWKLAVLRETWYVGLTGYMRKVRLTKVTWMPFLVDIETLIHNPPFSGKGSFYSSSNRGSFLNPSTHKGLFPLEESCRTEALDAPCPFH